jgi:tRNA(Ile)-lysidine synthase
LAYLEERSIPFRTDSTNADSVFLRNRIRNRLVPLLDELFPGWRTSLAHLGETQRLAADFIAAEAERRIPWDADGRTYRVSREVFFSQPEILREEGVFLAADKFGGKLLQPRRESVRLFTGGGCRALDLGAFRLEASGEWVVAASRGKISSEEGFSLLIKEPGIYKLDKYLLVLRCMPEEKGGDRIPGIKEKDSGVKERASGTRGSFRAGLPLVLRPSRSDDRISGTDGISRSLDRSRHSGYTGYITAEDCCGTATFIGMGKDGAVVLTGRGKNDSNGNDVDGRKEWFSFMIENVPKLVR